MMILLIICLIIIFIISNELIPQLTPKKYIVDSYLYLLLGIIFVGITWGVCDYFDLDVDIGLETFVVAFVVLAFLGRFISSIYYTKEHIVFLLFAIITGFMSHHIYKLNENVMMKKLAAIFIAVLITFRLDYAGPYSFDGFTSGIIIGVFMIFFDWLFVFPK